MAKIEFSKDEIEVLKKVAVECHENGAKSASEMLEKSGMNLEISDCAMPDIENRSDGCYACIACLATAFVAFVSYSR